LKTKAGEIRDLDLKSETGGNEEVYQALANLGFRREEIKTALRDLPEKTTAIEEIIKYALKKLSGRNYG